MESFEMENAINKVKKLQVKLPHWFKVRVYRSYTSTKLEYRIYNVKTRVLYSGSTLDEAYKKMRHCY